MSILLLLSCKKYLKVIESLSYTNYYELAYFFMKLCTQLELISVPECFSFNNLCSEHFKSLSSFTAFVSSEQANGEFKFLFRIVNNYLNYKKRLQ